MADTVSKKFVNSVVVHTPTGFFVANAGETKKVPAELLPRLTADGAFGDGKAAPVAEAEGGGDLDSLSNSKLRELAAAKGVEIPANANKTALLEALRAAGITSSVDGGASDGGVTSPGGPDAPSE